LDEGEKNKMVKLTHVEKTQIANNGIKSGKTDKEILEEFSKFDDYNESVLKNYLQRLRTIIAKEMM